jgi:Flp pilus assembly protein TadG
MAARPLFSRVFSRPWGAEGNAGERGSAIVEFVLVSTLLLMLFLGVVQTGIVLHIRNTLAADAAEGARHAASLGVPDEEGAEFAERLIAASLPGSAAAQCDARPAAGPGGAPVVEVTCRADVPLTLTLVGGSVEITVTGRALEELP